MVTAVHGLAGGERVLKATAVTLTAFLAITAAVAAPPDRKLALVDPNTQEGYFLHLIDSERDVNTKLILFEKFVIQFSQFPLIDAVYAEMQSLYVSIGQFDKAIGAGERILAIDRQEAPCERGVGPV